MVSYDILAIACLHLLCVSECMYVSMCIYVCMYVCMYDVRHDIQIPCTLYVAINRLYLYLYLYTIVSVTCPYPKCNQPLQGICLFCS